MELPSYEVKNTNVDRVLRHTQSLKSTIHTLTQLIYIKKNCHLGIGQENAV